MIDLIFRLFVDEDLFPLCLHILCVIIVFLWSYFRRYFSKLRYKLWLYYQVSCVTMRYYFILILFSLNVGVCAVINLAVSWSLCVCSLLNPPPEIFQITKVKDYINVMFLLLFFWISLSLMISLLTFDLWLYFGLYCFTTIWILQSSSLYTIVVHNFLVKGLDYLCILSLSIDFYNIRLFSKCLKFRIYN